MTTHLQAAATLHNGVKMPWFGLGVFQVEEGSELVNAVKTAIVHGYRSIDTAAIYGNEAESGKACGKELKKPASPERIYLSHQKCGMRI